MSSDVERFDTIRSRLFTAVIGDVLDRLGRTHQFLPPHVRPLTPDMRVVGRAMPVLLGDVYGLPAQPFGRLTEALDQLEPNDVYIAPGTTAEAAMWGELLTVTAQARGAVGAVVDGYHRDTAKVLTQGFPVFSRGNYAQDSAVRTVVNDYRVPVEIGSVTVRPGDIVVGDIDGVVIVPHEIEDEVIEAALEKASTENVVRRSIEAGMSSTEAFARYGVL